MSDHSKLSPRMQKRLEEWRKNILPVKSAKIFKPYRPNFVARRGDYGDDISDFEMKENLLWIKESDYRK